MDSTPANGICENCQRPLTQWPPRHDGYRGIVPVTPHDTTLAGDKYTCQSPLCNRYGFIVRVRSAEMSEAG